MTIKHGVIKVIDRVDDIVLDSSRAVHQVLRIIRHFIWMNWK